MSTTVEMPAASARETDALAGGDTGKPTEKSVSYKYSFDAEKHNKGLWRENSSFPNVHKASTYSTCLIMIADIVGVGVLSLSAGLAELGWIPGIIILVGMYPLCVYTGLMLSEVRTMYPNSPSYMRLSTNVGGRRLGIFTAIFAYLYIFTMLADYALTLGVTLGMVFYDLRVCLPVWAAIGVYCVVLPMHQMRSLASLMWILVVNLITLTASILIALIFLWSSGPAPLNTDVADTMYWSSVGQSYNVNPELDYFLFFKAVSTFTFAYSGHFLYVEMMAEMEKPEEFPKVFWIQAPYQVGMFVMVASTAYAYLGNNGSGFIINVLPYGIWYRVSSALLFIHVAITYLVKGTVLVRAIHCFVAPTRVNDRDWVSNIQWLSITLVTLTAAYIVANLIPFFDLLSGFIGALLAPTVCFNLPCILLVIARHNKGIQISWKDWVGIVLVNIFGALITVIGVTANLEAILSELDKTGGPFSCGCMNVWNSVSECCVKIASQSAFGGNATECFADRAMPGAIAAACAANTTFCQA